MEGKKSLTYSKSIGKDDLSKLPYEERRKILKKLSKPDFFFT